MYVCVQWNVLLLHARMLGLSLYRIWSSRPALPPRAIWCTMDALERALRDVLEDPDVKANVYRNGRFFSPRGKCRPLLRERLEKLWGTAAEDAFPKSRAIYEKLKELNSAEFRGRLNAKGLRDDAAELRHAGKKRRRQPGLYFTCPTCGSRRKLKSSRRLSLPAGVPAASSSARLCGDDEDHYPEEAPVGAKEGSGLADGAVDMELDAASAETSDTETREMEAEVHELAMALQELTAVVQQRRAALEGAGSTTSAEELPAHAAASSAAAETHAAPLPSSAEAETQLYNAPGEQPEEGEEDRLGPADDDSAPEGAARAPGDAVLNRQLGQVRHQQYVRDRIGDYMEHYVPNDVAKEMARASWALVGNRSRGCDRRATLKHIAAARALLGLPALIEAAPRNSRSGQAFTAWGQAHLQAMLTTSLRGRQRLSLQGMVLGCGKCRGSWSSGCHECARRELRRLAPEAAAGQAPWCLWGGGSACMSLPREWAQQPDEGHDFVEVFAGAAAGSRGLHMH